MEQWEEPESSETPKSDLWLWIIPLFLSGMGILAITSISGASSGTGALPQTILGMRQLKVLGLGLGLGFCAFLLPVPVWKRFSPWLWAAAVLLTFLTLMPGLGNTAGGASRWLRLGSVRFQPFELLAFSFVLHLCNRLTGETLSPRRAFFRGTSLFVISAAPLMLQPDLGGTLLLLFLAAGIYIERFGWKLPMITIVSSLLVFGPFVFRKAYRMRRITAFLDPWQDPQDTGFQVIQGLIAFANGGLWGVGVGKGLQKLQYLPAAHTDFIFAAIGEEMGLLGTGLILTLFLVWSVRMLHHYRLSPLPFTRSLIWGLTLSVLLPVLINVGGVTKMLPLTGMPLPFISYGGSALLFMWIRVGLTLRVCTTVTGREG